MNRVLYLSPQVGTPLLKFLWQWKLVSTAAIAKKFFPNSRSYNSTYNRLLHFKRHRYLELKRAERGEYTLWSLGPAGFRAIRDLLPPLREEGYQSEVPFHDWLTSAFHLGDWLIEQPNGVQLFSEQQLRRLEVELFPSWVPKDQQHRPDGYWHRMVANTSRTVALEMELTRKKAPIYQSVGSYYGEAAQINRVLWVVRTLSDASGIQQNLEKGPGSRDGIHSFVILDSFLKQGWSAHVEYGSGKNLTIESFLRKALGIQDEAIAGPLQGRGPTMAFLETRIKRIPTDTYGTRRDLEISRPTATSVSVDPAPHESRLIVPPEVSR